MALNQVQQTALGEYLHTQLADKDSDGGLAFLSALIAACRQRIVVEDAKTAVYSPVDLGRSEFCFVDGHRGIPELVLRKEPIKKGLISALSAYLKANPDVRDCARLNALLTGLVSGSIKTGSREGLFEGILKKIALNTMIGREGENGPYFVAIQTLPISDIIEALEAERTRLTALLESGGDTLDFDIDEVEDEDEDGEVTALDVLDETDEDGTNNSPYEQEQTQVTSAPKEAPKSEETPQELLEKYEGHLSVLTGSNETAARELADELTNDLELDKRYKKGKVEVRIEGSVEPFEDIIYFAQLIVGAKILQIKRKLEADINACVMHH